MRNNKKIYVKQAAILLLLCAFLSFSFIPKRKIIIYLVGDSTMADKSVKAYPETGWGMPFHYFFDNNAQVDNRAQNGRSTKTFIQEGRWASIYNALQPGDYVLIQFGHNDEVPTKRSYTPPAQFKANLLKFVADSRSKKAFPILITPVARRAFDSSGHLIDTHHQYANIVREAAIQAKVPLIDLDKLSRDLLVKWGPEKSVFLYNHLWPGENPHYSKGHADNTHFSELGARTMAEIVLQQIKDQHLGLADYIKNISQNNTK
ncbi:rhamnogalacturonan acetylesterase [Arachidicoccus sp.]|uniref:rhamnogalacturonan acetylesterase n=1 Tax=Arachidicoccus sp. TaxID=1872624 RepID=UPI003D1F01AD